jgi:mannose-6-phosphate isomerase class I
MYLGLSKETALSVFDYSYNLERVMTECKKTPSVIYEINGCKKECLIGKSDTPCFGVERYIINNGETDKLLAPCVYVVTDGNGILSSVDYEKEIKKGDYFFLPYSCKDKFTVKSKTNLTLAACLPPEV